MKSADGPAIVAAWSEHVLHAQFQDIDGGSVENAKMRILDMIGCALGGATLPDIVALVEMVKGWGGKGDASILGHGVKVPVHDAAMVNCLMGRSFDRGPLTLVIEGKRHPTHTSETTVLTALSLGEKQRIDGCELITALLVGDDLAARLWAATDRAQPGQEKQGGRRQPRYEPWGTITTIAAAAIAGRLLRLSAAEMRNAFGIAINMMPGAGSGLWDGATTFKLSQGTSARSGLLSAQLAKAGWTGIDDPLFSERGSYYATFASGCDHPEILTEDLGKKFHAEAVFKLYPGGRPTHAPVDAALALVRKHGIKAADIEAITLRMSSKATAAHYAKPYKMGGYPTGDALFNYRYSVAAALARGKLDNECFTETCIRDPQIQALVGKVVLAKLDQSEGVELEVVLRDGHSYRETVKIARGEPSNPLSKNDLVAKFLSQVRHSQKVSSENANTIVSLVGTLETVGDVSAISTLAAGG